MSRRFKQAEISELVSLGKAEDLSKATDNQIRRVRAADKYCRKIGYCYGKNGYDMTLLRGINTNSLYIVKSH